MPITIFSSDTKNTRHRLVAGVVLVFIVLFGLGYWLCRSSKIVDTYPLETLNQNFGPAQTITPQEIKNNYLSALTKAQTDWLDPAKTTDQKNKLLEEFFFSARVPEEMLRPHLEAMLKTKSVSSTNQTTGILVELEIKAQTTLSK